MKHILTFLSFILLMTACGSDHKTELAADTLPTVAVKIAKVTHSSSQATIDVSGTIQAANQVHLSPRMMGYLMNLNVKVGDRVNRGQILASISNDDIKAKEAQVQARIQEAKLGAANIKKDYDRIQTLVEQKSATQKELDDISAHYEMAQQGIKQAEQMLAEVKANLAYTQLKAPISGVVTEKMLQSGDMATPGRPVLTIEAPGNYQAVVNIPESNITQVKEGQNATVVIKATGQELSGRISELSRSAQATGGQYTAKINLPAQKGQQIYAGMFVNVYLQAETETTNNTERITVLKKALYERGQLTGLFVAADNKTALLRWVRLGKDMGDRVEVLSGLAADETYIIEAKGKLVNGAHLTIQ